MSIMDVYHFSCMHLSIFSIFFFFLVFKINIQFIQFFFDNIDDSPELIYSFKIVYIELLEKFYEE